MYDLQKHITFVLQRTVHISENAEAKIPMGMDTSWDEGKMRERTDGMFRTEFDNADRTMTPIIQAMAPTTLPASVTG